MKWRSNYVKFFDKKLSLMRRKIYYTPINIQACAKTCVCDRTSQTARTDICPGAACELATIESCMEQLGAAWSTIEPRQRAVWEKFHEVLPLVTSTNLFSQAWNVMAVVLEVHYFMLVNNEICRKRKCNAFCEMTNYVTLDLQD